MAYYTIAHLLHGEANMFGDAASPSGVKAEQLTDEVFDYIYLKGSKPTDSDISADLLDQMRKEFEYWYPMDLRVSAKDLIPNHLTMALYNHAAVWQDYPELWPRGYYCNGHILVDAEKMSKSMGNFLMMKDCCIGDTFDAKGDATAWSADATRLALVHAPTWINGRAFSATRQCTVGVS